ncbi:hypothetical protein OF83DRAFT_157082 [Amylostereum chailletii]|nr:hypothetical protein OF83DRAFT_157082 [Amylostereum chailletii]
MAEHRTTGNTPSLRPQCPGCNCVFDRPSGLSQHLAKSSRMGSKANPFCRAAYLSLPATTPSEPEAVEDTHDPEPAPPEHPPPAFEGDFFGHDYNEADFGVDMNIDNPDEPPMPGLESDDEDDEDEEDRRDEEVDAELYNELMTTRWEPAINPNSPAGPDVSIDPAADSGEMPAQTPATEQRQCSSVFPSSNPIIVPFPLQTAGAPISQLRSPSEYEAQRMSNDTQGTGNIWVPFKSKIDWTMAYWAKMRGPSSTAMTELLQMDEIPQRLGLSYETVGQLNKIIDQELPGRPKFKTEQVHIGSETLDVHYRDIIPCIRALFGDPEYAKHLVFAPERRYRDVDQTVRMYDEMNTGKWWWNTQMRLEASKPGATVIPASVLWEVT